MIPDWNLAGVLPPIRPEMPGHALDRSPYRVGLYKIISKFAVSSERIAILEGLLRYRKALHALGLVEGFQWLDGSFMEAIEVLETRPPKDIDVVTFFHMPDGLAEQELVEKNPDLFNNKKVKLNYSVDAYLTTLGEPQEAHHVKEVSYWYSMWSHRRDFVWKGFLQVDLSPREDEAAWQQLEAVSEGDEL